MAIRLRGNKVHTSGTSSENGTVALSVVHGQSPVYFKTGFVHGFVHGGAVCFFIAAFVACGGGGVGGMEGGTCLWGLT